MNVCLENLFLMTSRLLSPEGPGGGTSQVGVAMPRGCGLGEGGASGGVFAEGCGLGGRGLRGSASVTFGAGRVLGCWVPNAGRARKAAGITGVDNRVR